MSGEHPILHRGGQHRYPARFLLWLRAIDIGIRRRCRNPAVAGLRSTSRLRALFLVKCQAVHQIDAQLQEQVR
ncbi:MAG: hypothetical protein ACK58C_19375, partial [Betaproteobacteria bacterium]